ncbi:MAG: hypothetical protein QXK18_02605 [Candidatus Bathyarchaeia archaeon]
MKVFLASISFFFKVYWEKFGIFRRWNIGYTYGFQNSVERSTKPMNSEIKELNRIICRQCDEKEYDKCKNCKVYQLVNKLVAQ